MFFNSYQNNIFVNRRRNSQTSIKILNDYTYKIAKSFLQKKQPIKLISSFSFRSYKPIKSNYINYTVLENNNKDNYLSRTSRENNNYTNSKNSKKFRIVNDYLKHNNSNSSYKTSFRNNDNKINVNKKFFLKKYDKMIDTNKQNEALLETKTNEPSFFEANEKDIPMKKFEKYRFIQSLNKKSGIPIGKRIKLLKEAKCSINQMKKNSFNSFSSYKSIFDDNNQNNYFDKSTIEKKKYKLIPFNNILDKKPIIIKHLEKPKLEVPKFININQINLF